MWEINKQQSFKKNKQIGFGCLIGITCFLTSKRVKGTSTVKYTTPVLYIGLSEGGSIY